MTRLLVTPLDPTAPGSYRKRQRLLTSIRKARVATTRIEAMRAQINADPGLEDTFAADRLGQSDVLIDVQMDLDTLIRQSVTTDDGSSVETVLDEISANDFDELLRALLGDSSIPNSTSAN